MFISRSQVVVKLTFLANKDFAFENFLAISVDCNIPLFEAAKNESNLIRNGVLLIEERTF